MADPRRTHQGVPAWTPQLTGGISEDVFAYYRRLSRVRRLVATGYRSKISLTDAAEAAGMEATAFSAFFHQKTGIRFRDWLAEVRIAEAQHLFATRNITVREAGRQVGLGNVRTFERVFLRVTGRTPIDYKNSVRPA